MARDETLRISLVSLAAIVVLIGFVTFSFKKMIVTYVFGLLAIAGLILPDWEFFDRDFSEWFSPMPADTGSRGLSRNSRSTRFKIYPLRLILYTTVYSFALYKWWTFIVN